MDDVKDALIPVNVIIGMNRPLAGQRCTGKLAATIGDDLVYVHVEVRNSSRYSRCYNVVTPAQEHHYHGTESNQGCHACSRQVF